MPDSLAAAASVALDFFAHGLWRDATWWQVALVTLALTHVTIVAVTVFLHRAQAHRALDLGPVPSHFFRLWLWLTTGMGTKEWVAVHRKHHAKCETVDDPHSPVTHGIRTVLLRGSELYRAEAKNAETIAKYGRGTPDDWLERRVYQAHPYVGIFVMMAIDVSVFGALGLTVWAVQMAWIPVTAAGIINGLGHHRGYRNFEAADASTNISPWGVIIGGEELHNNHHTYPTSAKLSVKPFEFDIGWGYIRALEMLGWAKVRKIAPRLATERTPRPEADGATLEALIAHRYEVMAGYAAALRRACAAEVERLSRAGAALSPDSGRLARRWLHRDAEKIPSAVRPQIERVVEASPTLAKYVTMREELRQFWTRTNVSAEQLSADLAAWCRRAEASGIDALAEFSTRLRAARV